MLEFRTNNINRIEAQASHRPQTEVIPRQAVKAVLAQLYQQAHQDYRNKNRGDIA